MIGGQEIAKLDELAARVVCRVGCLSSMMKMNFDFSPTPVAELPQTLKVRSVILLGGEKIGVDKWPTFVVTPTLDNARVFPTPTFQPLFLLVVGRTGCAVSRNIPGFEVIGQRKDQMDLPSRNFAS